MFKSNLSFSILRLTPYFISEKSSHFMKGRNPLVHFGHALSAAGSRMSFNCRLSLPPESFSNSCHEIFLQEVRFFKEAWSELNYMEILMK